MSDVTPSRTSRRLNLKRKLEGPEAVSPIHRIRKKYGEHSFPCRTVTPTQRRKSGQDRARLPSPKEKERSDYNASPTKKRKIAQPPLIEKNAKCASHDSSSGKKSIVTAKAARKEIRKALLKVKLKNPVVRLVDIKLQHPSIQDFAATKSVAKGKRGKLFSKKVKEVSPDIPREESNDAAIEKTKEEIEPEKILIAAFANAPSEGESQAEDSQFFSLFGAVVASELACELDTGEPEWKQKASEHTSVQWTARDSPCVAFGTVDQLIQAQSFLKQLLEKVREEFAKQIVESPSIEETLEDAADQVKSSLKAKRRTKAVRKQEELIKCDMCKGRFVSEEALKRHGEHHSNRANTAEENEVSTAVYESLLQSIDTTDLSRFYEALGDDGEKAARNVIEESEDSQEATENNTKCSLCAWQGSTDQYVIHIGRAHGHKKYTCEVCDNSFSQLGRYQSHFAKHFDKEGNLLEARVKQEVVDVETHLKTTPSIVADEGGAVQTDTRTPIEMVMDAMMESVAVEPDEGTTALAQQAEDIVAGTSVLQEDGTLEATDVHLPEQMALPTEDQDDQVPVSPLQTTEETTDPSHVAVQQPGVITEETVECDECGNMFVKGLLNLHKARSHSHKKYACPLCNRKMSMFEDFDFHYTQHFNRQGKIRESFLQKDITPEEQQVLEKCWAENPKVVPQHVIEKAEIQLVASPTKKTKAEFKCKFCNFKARNEAAMKAHVGRHLKTKEEKSSRVCSYCSKGFASEMGLLRHMAKVHDVQRTPDDPTLTEHVKKFMAQIDPYDPDSWEILMATEEEAAQAGTILPGIGNIKREILDNDESQDQEKDGLEGLMSVCGICGYKGSKHAIYKHKLRQHATTNEKCEYCSKTFAVLTDLKTHVKHVHMDKDGELKPETVITEEDSLKVDPRKNFMCRLCGFKSVQPSVRNHIIRKHKPGGFKCDQCDAVFGSKQECTRHAKSHLTPREVENRIKGRRRFAPERRWMCHLCPYTTKHSETDLKEHISRKHEAPKFKCSYCGKMFGVIYDLTDHVNHMHLRTKRVICDHCGIELHQKNLKTHIRRVHEKLRPFKCDICGRTFGEKRFLLKHKMRHQPKEMRKSTVYCRVCNKAYVDEKSLDDHMNKHRGIKPYECNLCGAKFGIKTMWQRHVRNHERGLIKCPITGCNRQAENEATLNKHMVKKHKETAQYRCAGCHQVFAMASAMKRHQCMAAGGQAGGAGGDIWRKEATELDIESAISAGTAFVLKKQQAEDGSMVHHVVMDVGEGVTDEQLQQSAFVIKQEHLPEALDVNQQIVEITNAGEQEYIGQVNEAGDLIAIEGVSGEGEGVRVEGAMDEQEGGEEETKIYMCSICQEIFSSMEAIEQHILGHQGVAGMEEEGEAEGGQEGAIDPQQLVTTSAATTSAEDMMVTEEAVAAAAEAGQTLYVDGDNQAIFAIMTDGGLEAIQGTDIETANTLADLSGLLTQ